MGFGSHGGHGHSHSHDSDHNHHSHKSRFSCSKTVRLSIMLSMTFGFFLVELIVGEITHSITLTADSFHMLSDVIALCIGLFSVRISKKKTSKNTFGWVRAEVLGALVNSVFLVSLCLSILIETIKRFIEKEDIAEVDMLLYVACTGLGINLIGLVIFGHGHSHGVPEEAVKELEKINIELDSIVIDEITNINNIETVNGLMTTDGNDEYHSDGDKNETVQIKQKKNKNSTCCHILSKQANLNIRAVFLHVLADALGSVIVIISALLNKFQTELHISKNVIRYIDPILCLFLVTLILSSTIPLFKETALILLQTVPKDIQLNQLKEELNKVKGILSVHELHIWKLSGNKIIASAHITCHSLQEYMQIAAKVKVLFHEKGIHSTTIQPEFVDPIDEVKACMLECMTNCNENTCCGQSNGLRIRNQQPIDSLNINNNNDNTSNNINTFNNTEINNSR